MSYRVNFMLLLATIGMLSACKKEGEIQLKEVDKTYSWTEVKQLFGLSKVVLGTAKDAGSLYLQTPGLLGRVSPGAANRRYFENVSLVGWLPYDVNVKVPIAANLYAWPAGDTIIVVTPMAEPSSSQYSDYIHLRKLDPQASTVYNTTVRSSTAGDYQVGAINQNDYLLVAYRRTTTGPADPPMRLMLAHVTKNSFRGLKAQAQVLSFPAIPVTTSFPYVYRIVAIDDYFLVGHSERGIYKVKQDGSIRLVSNQTGYWTIYKYQGKIYAYTSDGNNSVLISTDEGETWTKFSGIPSYFLSSSMHVIGDSLVGYVRPFNQLYTLRWNNATGKVRELKNDGLRETSITGIELLRDTVYIGTTSGLFKRPLKNFFESKP
ncbi:hypothetical protein [Hymenobacter arizonensis]|uniref:BNR repeat-like domain-containing protein n=1 Tax=Hymenobacter arizonensis TaxID=1227077 RepID=A0A1I5ZRC9_HYMAR|nr:hypothetical protein [Hymenobacter arizonensis]SFQ58923.1 hypothetical protein SAMN04515668_3142 [Hymenobacter arizonensis]